MKIDIKDERHLEAARKQQRKQQRKTSNIWAVLMVDCKCQKYSKCNCLYIKQTSVSMRDCVAAVLLHQSWLRA
jgi:hypothetical protein